VNLILLSAKSMSGMPDMTLMSLAATVAPQTGKIIKNCLRVFERGEGI